MPGDTPKAKCPTCGIHIRGLYGAACFRLANNNTGGMADPWHHAPPLAAPATPGDTPFDAALAALDVEAVPDGKNFTVHYDILGLDAVRAAHRAEVARLSARVAKLEAALREIAGRGPKDDPCADEYDADGKRWSEVGGEATWCTYTSDESQEESAHASDVAAYAAAKIARAALEAPCKGDSPEAAEEDKS